MKMQRYVHGAAGEYERDHMRQEGMKVDKTKKLLMRGIIIILVGMIKRL